MAIIINNIKKTFGEKVASDIKNLTINEGEILGLVGNNGAGKTTLFRLILDLIKADEGSVVLTNGEDSFATNETEEWKKFTGAFIDSGFLIEYLTPEEYFNFIAKVENIDKAALDEKLEKYAPLMAGEILGQKKLIRDLSAGNKQKVGIIGAMLNNPSILILDEPFNFLDPKGQNILKKIIEDYNRETNATVIISSHNLTHTIDISTRIVLMESGLVIKDLCNKDQSAEKELEEYFTI
ncbi:MAG: ABC transporter ATP-binding protein [Bacteroidaceae bacterium]|nr:ABC transporter ATP-binding protein [Bacteroidaceae bacterium]